MQNKPITFRNLLTRGAAVVAGVFLCASPLPAANIVWVSDHAPGGFSGPGSGLSDQGFITLLQNAGHNVIRFNPPDAQATRLTAAELTALNTNDLVIISRAIGSGAFQSTQVIDWNVGVTKPLFTVNAYLVRANRLGWATGSTTPDGTPTPLTAVDLTNPKAAYLFGGVVMNGNNTANSYDEALDRNTSHILENPVTGGVILARAAFTDLGGTARNLPAIVEWPAGTPVRGGADTLGGYRLFMAAGSREVNGAAVTTAGVENLTATGENIFLRAVALALSNGNVPEPPSAPTGLTGAASDSTALLSWNPATFAMGYNVKRSDTPGGPYTLVGSTAGTTFTQGGLINDQTYYFVVTATNNSGESASSAEVSVTPRAAPGNVTAVGGTNQVTVSWSAFPDAQSYTVLRSSVSGGPYAPVQAGITDTTFVDQTVSGGRTYYYVVSAQLTGGSSSGQSLQATAVTAPNAPGINVELWASTVIRVSWTTTDPVVSGFVLESGTDGENFSPLATLPSSQRGFTNSGLNASTTYYYRVRAENSAGSSPFATAGTSTPAGGYNINFANGTAPTPPGYVQDIGELFGNRTNGFFYGWNNEAGTNIVVDGRWRTSIAPDLRYATFNHMQKSLGGAYWEIEIPNGFYRVRVVGGDNDNSDSTFQYNIEGHLTPVYVGTTAQRFADFTVQVGVSDGRLTIANGPSAANNKIAFVDIYPAVPVAPTIAAQPQPIAIEEYRPFSLSVSAAGSAKLMYQWYFNSEPIENATNAVLHFPRAALSHDGNYYVVITNYGGSIVSDDVDVTVIKDTVGPRIVSVGSVDGRTIGICFSEELDTNSIPVTENGNYQINGGDVSVLTVTPRPGGRSFVLQLHQPISGPFTVDALDIPDFAGNTEGVTSASGEVLGFNAADIGTPQFAGSNFTCDGDEIEIIGGGADIWGSADQAYLAMKPVTGDFDLRMRVESLRGSNTITKAVLVARETTAPGSRALHVSVNPPPPGRNLLEMGYRHVENGATALVGGTFTPANIPDAWMRITRLGDTFTGYRSSNGVDWVVLGTTNTTFPAEMQVGFGLTAHDNTLLATGVVSGVVLIQDFPDVSITGVSAPEPVIAGQNVTYTLTVENNSPGIATGVRVTHPLPSGLTAVSAEASQGSCTVENGTVTCLLGTLPAGGDATITVVASTTAAGAFTSTTTVTLTETDTNTSNNSAQITVNVSSAPAQERIGNVSFSGGSFSAAIQTQNGVTYELQMKEDLNATQWTTIATIQGDGTVKTFSDANPSSPMRFYRIVIP